MGVNGGRVEAAAMIQGSRDQRERLTKHRRHDQRTSRMKMKNEGKAVDFEGKGVWGRMGVHVADYDPPGANEPGHRRKHPPPA
ncbi:hypothetical protein U1Q18_013928 [Sarracenia purpurea var. burkii]